MHNLFDLNDRTAVVTGAARGIGLSLARGLADAGVKVAIMDIADNVDEIAKSQLGENSIGIKANLMEQPERENAFDIAADKLGKIDIFINNAGMQSKSDFLDYPDDKWASILELNLTCAFSFMKLAGKHMKENSYGKIINVASMNAFLGGTQCPAYAASKGGLVQLTKSGSNELSRYGINVNAIAPGFIITELTKHIIDDPIAYSTKTSRIPMGRWGEVTDLIGTVLFLSSHASDYVSGIVIPIDGGYLAK